jgi:hypothetical protein
MKKLLVTLLALATIGVAFADDAAAPKVSLGSWGRYQATVFDSASKNQIGPDWSGSGVYAGLGLSYSADLYGFSSWANINNTTSAWTFENYYGYVKPFGDFFKLSVGVVDSTPVDVTTFADSSHWSRWHNFAGYAIESRPVAGLVLAFANKTTGDATTAFSAIGAGVGYTITDIATVNAYYASKGYTGGSDTIVVDANVKAIKDLGLLVGFQNAGSTSDILLSASKSVGALSAALDADVTLASTLGVYTAVNASYKVTDTVTPGLYANWKLNGSTEIKPNVSFAAGGSALNVAFDMTVASTGTTWAIPLTFDIGF